ncbi:hypothetical protein [Roseivirga sp.]|uniref:DinB family protein n=1 Tax=Roseivirga sp. TaxID=1964215 RepID=UPI002B2679AD|nr:hypothetical protein [Roseivirga sp.]
MNSRKTIFFILFLLSFVGITNAQDLPFREMPPFAKAYTSGTLMGRMSDGLGFRFYWATEGLNVDNLNFKAGEESRTIGETVDHIYTLVLMFTNAVMEQPTTFPIETKDLTFIEKRSKVLSFIQTASALLKMSNDEDFERYNLVSQFAGGNGQKLPFWNGLNGPLEDALWHIGQVVTLRRMAGNPINPKVDFMNGRINK